MKLWFPTGWARLVACNMHATCCCDILSHAPAGRLACPSRPALHLLHLSCTPPLPPPLQVFLKDGQLYGFKGLAGKLGPIGVHASMLLCMLGFAVGACELLLRLVLWVVLLAVVLRLFSAAATTGVLCAPLLVQAVQGCNFVCVRMPPTWHPPHITHPLRSSSPSFTSPSGRVEWHHHDP